MTAGGDGDDATSGRRGRTPRALVHKQILEEAEADPDASVAAIAEAVSGATPDLVEDVLEEYGDPGADEADDESDGTGDDAGESGEPSGNVESSGNGESAGVASDPETSAETATTGAPTEEADGTSAEEGEENVANAEGAASAADVEHAAGPEGAASVSPPGRTETGSGVETTDLSDGSSGASPAERVPGPDELSERQLRVIRAIARRPEATQSAIAEELDVSRATVWKRLDDLDGFEWSERVAFVREVFGDVPGPDLRGSSSDGASDGAAAVDGGEHRSGADPTIDGAGADDRTAESGRGVGAGEVAGLAERVDDLSDRVDALAEAVSADGSVAGRGGRATDSGATTAGGPSPENGEPGSMAVGLDGAAADPELVHKVAHACLEADYVSREEELALLRALLGGRTD